MRSVIRSIAFGLAVCALASIFGCSREDARPSGHRSFGGTRPAAVVSTVAVGSGPSVVEARFVGTLEARAFADLYAKTTGQIIAVFADTGDPVRKGVLLARIDDAEAREGLNRSRAAVGMSAATLEERRAALEVARAKARRTEALAERELVSVEENEETRADLLAAEARLRLAEAALLQARANEGSAQVELERTRIVAPFDGFVGKRYLDLGALAATNRPVFSIVDLAVIETTVSLTERDAARIAVGQPAEITTDTFPTERFVGRVARIASIFDPDTHTTEAEIEVDNADGRLKPGMFANVRIAAGEPVTALLIPAAALIDRDREPHLFVAEHAGATHSAKSAGSSGEADSAASAESAANRGSAPSGDGWVARRVNVTLLGAGVDGDGEGAQSDRRIAVEPLDSNLAAGDRVVVLGQEGLRDGAPVTMGEPRPQPST